MPLYTTKLKSGGIGPGFATFGMAGSTQACKPRTKIKIICIQGFNFREGHGLNKKELSVAIDFIQQCRKIVYPLIRGFDPDRASISKRFTLTLASGGKIIYEAKESTRHGRAGDQLYERLYFNRVTIWTDPIKS